MPYTGHQKRVASHVYDVGRKSGANRKQLLAALETALVESNLGNPKGGHGTSSGWRQQITGAGVKSQNRQNVRQQAKYFFDEIKGAKGGTAGQMAQAVQRSAHPERYDAREKQAGDLLQHLEKTQGKGGSGSRITGGELRGKTRTTPGVDRSAERQSLKLSYLENRNDPSALLNLAGGLRGARDTPSSKSLELSRAPYKRVKDGGGRSFRGKANLSGKPMDRPGVSTDKLTRRVVRDASRKTPITVGTGSQHSQMTTSGNQSDHWTGKALDLPAKGVKGDHTAGAILMRLGVSRKKARAMAQKGGAHTVKDKSGRRWQVIWKTNIGGNHHDHVHVGHG